jgi:dihydropyrimidinase
MQTAGQLGAMVSIHAENGSIIDLLVKSALAEGKTSPVYHALTRPPVLEAEAVNRAIALAELSGVTLYLVHLSTSDGLNHVRAARKKGLPVLAETCPQYLVCALEDMIDSGPENSAKFVFTPPPREKANQKALWLGLADRTIQVVATDHCPFHFKGQKYDPAGDFSKIPNGAPGIENRLEIVFESGVNKQIFNLNRWVDICCTAPARIFGLYPQKGTIAVGSDADLVIWDPEKIHTISAARHHMKVDYNLYEGMQIRGKADAVILRGELIIQNDQFLGRKGRGHFLKRGIFNGELL